jgi:signal transduction histidine kinase
MPVTGWYCPAMRDRIRDSLAIAIALACLAIGLGGAVQPPTQFTGVTLRMETDGLYVDTVDPASTAVGFIRPNMRVLAINGIPADQLDPMGLDLYMSGDFVTLSVEDDKLGGPVDASFPIEAEAPDPVPFLIGFGVLAGIAVLVRRSLAGEALRPLALPIAAASAAPLLVAPTWTRVDSIGVAVVTVLPAAAALLLADGLLGRIAIPLARRIALTSITLGGVALPLGVLAVAVREQAATPPNQLAVLVTIAMALSAGVTLVTTGALVVSTSRVARGRSVDYRSDRLPILLAAATPVVTALSAAYLEIGYGALIPLAWLLVAVVLLQTNGRLETLRLQRDTIVAATEAERARLAADLHDDALQQMSVLIRRLDHEGAEGDAEMARSIADRLRDVCGDLRLPILDELGAGPALEWLVARVGEASGGPVRLQRTDVGRPPADVELAFFRIAQEALSNAVSHGAPPITVAYDATGDRAALSITDQGGGIPEGAAASAPRAGHYGLLNMRQRAEQIGASLAFERAPDGGTAVGLRWVTA